MVFILLNALIWFVSVPDALGQCEPLRVPQCLQMPWNSTRMPNVLMHRNQMEVSEMFDKFAEDRQCKSKLVLCSLLAPVCTNVESEEGDPIVLLPCLSFCLRLCPNLHECRSLLRDASTCFQPPEDDILTTDQSLSFDERPNNLQLSSNSIKEHQKFLLVMSSLTLISSAITLSS
ncbi:hypothetical protein ACOME3_009094 [Neoechinorhynchus agilis]